MAAAEPATGRAPVMLSAGEASGDLHGGMLCRALREMEPGVRLVGMGGRHMRAAGMDVVVDPTEERLRDEFKNTKMLHLPMQCIVRIEEVEKIGPLSIRDATSGDKIMPFPIAPPRSSGK